MCGTQKLLIGICLTLSEITLNGYGYGSDIKRTPREASNTRSSHCILPDYPQNGIYFVYGSEETYSPGMLIGEREVLIIECNNGYQFEGVVHILCTNGNWSYPVGKCIRTCPSRNSTSRYTVTCSYNGKLLPDCTNPIDGTLARFSCKPFYEDPFLNRRPVHVCRDGAWSYPTPECTPVCGLKQEQEPSDGRFKRAINGTNARIRDSWQAAIYRVNDHELICGGTLISQRIVLTAAHCVTDTRGKRLPKENYVVAVGKYYRKYDDNRDKNDAQFSELQEYFIPKNYKGQTQNYVGDIAVLVTVKTFDLSLNVQPVCVDWELNYNKGGEYGYVAGWGFTSENAHPSEVLQELEVPLITTETCKKNLPGDFDVYVTFDKLCAGYIDKGKSVCRGDSGGGLVVKCDYRRYFIVGILSLAPLSDTGPGCNKGQYGLYTSVEQYINFIKQIEVQYSPAY